MATREVALAGFDEAFEGAWRRLGCRGGLGVDADRNGRNWSGRGYAKALVSRALGGLLFEKRVPADRASKSPQPRIPQRLHRSLAVAAPLILRFGLLRWPGSRRSIDGGVVGSQEHLGAWSGPAARGQHIETHVELDARSGQVPLTQPIGPLVHPDDGIRQFLGEREGGL